MSSKPRNRTVPRNWTEEQVQYIMGLVRNHTNREIADLFNQRYQGVASIGWKQVKYIRTSYGRDPGWGVPLILGQQGRQNQTVGRQRRQNQTAGSVPVEIAPTSAPTITGGGQSLTSAAVQAAAQEAAQATIEQPSTIPVSQPLDPWGGFMSPANTPAYGVTPRFGESSQSLDSGSVNVNPWDPVHPVQPDEQLTAGHTAPNAFDFSQPMDFGMAGAWHYAAHNNCEVNGPHRHNLDGGVYFPSLDSLRQTAQATWLIPPMVPMAPSIQQSQESGEQVPLGRHHGHEDNNVSTDSGPAARGRAEPEDRVSAAFGSFDGEGSDSASI